MKNVEKEMNTYIKNKPQETCKTYAKKKKFGKL